MSIVLTSHSRITNNKENTSENLQDLSPSISNQLSVPSIDELENPNSLSLCKVRENSKKSNTDESITSQRSKIDHISSYIDVLPTIEEEVAEECSSQYFKIKPSCNACSSLETKMRYENLPSTSRSYDNSYYEIFKNKNETDRIYENLKEEPPFQAASDFLYNMMPSTSTCGTEGRSDHDTEHVQVSPTQANAHTFSSSKQEEFVNNNESSNFSKLERSETHGQKLFTFDYTKFCNFERTNSNNDSVQSDSSSYTSPACHM